MAPDLLMFYAFAAVAVVASLLVVGQRSPVRSVMMLIVSFAALAGIYVLLDSPFAAVIQIIVYAGAILVLFLFTVMLVAGRGGGLAPSPRFGSDPRRAGAVLGLLLAAELLWALGRCALLGGPVAGDAEGSRVVASVYVLGRVLYTSYSFAFEVTSLLALVAMIGAVVLAKRRA